MVERKARPELCKINIIWYSEISDTSNTFPQTWKLRNMDSIVLNSKYLKYLLSYLQDRGVSHAEALRGTSFQNTNKTNLEGLLCKGITDIDLNQIIVNATKQLSITVYQLGFELGLRMTTTSHGSLGVAILCCDTIKTAMMTYSDYVALVSPAFKVNIYAEKEWLALEPVPIVEISDNVYLFLMVFGVCSPLFDKNLFDTGVLGFDEKVIIEISKDDEVNASFLKLFEQFFIFRYNAPCSRALIPIAISSKILPMANEDTRQSILTLCNDELESTSNSFLEQVTQFLVKNQRFLSLEELADKLNMSTRTLHRHLHENGTSYSKLVARIKMEQAKRMLMRTDKNIQSIGLELGFSETTNFSSAFKKYQGMTPNQFRKKQQIDKYR